MEIHSKKIFDLLKEAKSFSEEKKWEDARQKLEEALAMAETHKIKVLIQETLVDCAFDMDDYEYIIKYLEGLCELDFTLHSAAKLTQIYVYYSEYGKASDFAKRFKDIEIKDDEDRLGLIDLYFKAGKIAEALAEYDIWKENHPDDFEIKKSVFKKSITNWGNRNTYYFHSFGARLHKLADELISQNAEKEIYGELADLHKKSYNPAAAMGYLKKMAALCKENGNEAGYIGAANEIFMYSHYCGLIEEDEYIKLIHEIYNAYLPEKVNTEFKVNTNYLKKIRVGFVSSDFYTHSVGKFISSLFKQKILNSEIEIYCYYTLNVEDDINLSISKAADCFKYVGHYNDAQLGSELLNDNLDIIIDLNNRSFSSKLSLLSHRFAPVQMTWMGFPFTCAVPNIDFAIGDPFLDPPDNRTEIFMTEKIARMKPSYMCYALDLNNSLICPAEDPPCFKNGYITFGNMNNPMKFSPHTLKLWSSVLEAVPNSKLYIKIPDMDDYLRDMFIRRFTEAGIAWKRVTASPPTNQVAYMNAYNDIDIMLDTTPFSGCTTLAESFFMGMPTVSLKGKYRQSRHFVLLEQVGLGDLAADSDGEYVEKAKNLANNRERIKKIKNGLPPSLKDSPMFDTFKFRLSFENMVRQIYVRHCYKNKKPFDADMYEGNANILLDDCMRAHEVLNYLISDGEETGLIASIVNEYYKMATLLLSVLINTGGLPDGAEETVGFSLKALTLLNTVKDTDSAVKLIESNNKLLISLGGNR